MGFPVKEKTKSKIEKKPISKKSIADMFLEEDRKLTHDKGESDMVVPVEFSKTEPTEEPIIKKEVETMSETRWDLFAAYLFAPLGSIILWLLNKENRTVFHCKQSAVLWVISFILSFVMIGLLVWLYMIYVGFKAANGEDVIVPVITDAITK